MLEKIPDKYILLCLNEKEEPCYSYIQENLVYNLNLKEKFEEPAVKQ